MDIEKDLTPSREGDRPPYADRWHTLSDWMRVNLRSKDQRFWSDAYPHTMTGIAVDHVAGVPRGWTVHLCVDDGEAIAMFYPPAEKPGTVSVVSRPDDIAARMDLYRRYIWEPKDLAAEMWEQREAA
ncbi:hypothetical protein Sa4125_00350 [Aureimonas sp. SA4125]|uniref:hypothetical protein n=1 Tax=Aureimonas sp. SA4125 TaxID=2826993 RepID=UPI001CC5E92E|nr:hypothetical protein [Aureimonas sp. SA4125]BDA82493.1 hypothetical protein Sa4125_00350 [Aureimonas sp. SA4125]